MKCPAEVYQALHPPLPGIARHRLSLPRQGHCRYQLRSHLLGEQKD
jgi:hypothetical protein